VTPFAPVLEVELALLPVAPVPVVPVVPVPVPVPDVPVPAAFVPAAAGVVAKMLPIMINGPSR
jgi:hypothetical protein